MIYRIPLQKNLTEYVVNIPNEKAIIRFRVIFRYNLVGEFWSITLKDVFTGEDILTGIPLLRKQDDNNIYSVFNQVQYKGLGEPLVMKVRNEDGPGSTDSPMRDNLTVDFELYWSKV